MELQIRAFFFNVSMDYLPFHKNVIIDIDRFATAEDILMAIQKEERDFSYPKSNLYFRVNGLVVSGEQKVQEIVNKLGTTLQIDPILNYRATNGLIINDDDFMESFALLAPYASDDDRAHYATLYPLHYASETFQYDTSYIGDAVLVMAHKMIADGNENREAILDAINEDESGLFACEYDNNLFEAQDHSETIGALKAMTSTKVKPTLGDKLSAIMARKITKEPEITSLEGRKICHYVESSDSDQSIDAELITFGMATKKAGQSLFEVNPNLAYRKAATMLLDALDNGADLLVLAKEEDTLLFRANIGNMENTIGRDIPIDFISQSTFMELSKKAVA